MILRTDQAGIPQEPDDEPKVWRESTVIPNTSQ